jgi:excisionase family DNA binding protein
MTTERHEDTYFEALRELGYGRAAEPERTEFLTVAEIARTLRVSRNTVYRLVATAQLPAVKLGDGPNPPIRVPKVELDRYVSRSTIGADVAEQAERLVARRGEDPDDAEAYFQALKDLEADAAIFADRIRHVVHAQVEEAHRRGYFATATRPVGSDVVDIERIMREELDRLGFPVPDEVMLLGPKGLGREALRILKDKGVTEYDERGYRAAIRQAIKNALNPKRKV